ncbi:alpha/beta-hydrolase [Chiua virens]|nr:alpha/beta-hydrolase [Chiua virens]
MPFIHLPSQDDFVSIWYITNSAYGNVGSFDPEKPTVVIMHPLFLDSSWLTMHFDDPRLTVEYNIIAFDQRTQGRSRSRPSALHDCYVDAADLASAIQALFLPPAHFLAIEGISVNAVLRLAALYVKYPCRAEFASSLCSRWPEFVLSLTLVNVPPPTELKWVFNAYDELLRLWCYAPDLDSFEHAGSEVVTFMTGEYRQLIAYWEKVTPPAKRLRIVELVNILMNRTKINKKELGKITCPVFIVQNEQMPIAPLVYAETLRDDITEATGIEPRFYVIRGATACVSIILGNTSLVNRVFAGFLSQLPRSRSDLRPPAMPTVERAKLALQTLSELVGDPSIAHRNPKSLLSFSCVTPEVAKSQLDSLKFYAKEIDNAYCPLSSDGRPIRKSETVSFLAKTWFSHKSRFSERKLHHWFHGDSRGISHVDPEVLIAARQYVRPASPELPPKLDAQSTANGLAAGLDLVTEAVAQDGRVRRTTVNDSTVERQIIKGSMLKVVTQSSYKGPVQLAKSLGG